MAGTIEENAPFHNLGLRAILSGLMGLLIALLGILFVAVLFDIFLRLSYYLDPRNRFSNVSRLQFEGLRNMLAVAKAYVGFRIIHDSRLTQELPERFLIIANHQSLADIPVLAYAFPRHNVRFVAKKELKYGLPAISFTLRKAQHALVSRKGDFRSAHRELVRLARLAAREAICPTVFPEGTRARNGMVKRFHSAAVRTILAQCPMPALSVAVDGGYRICRLTDLMRNIGGCEYRVRLLSLYPPVRGRSRIQAMLQTAHDEIKRQVEEWRKSENKKYRSTGRARSGSLANRSS
jgi:1-acyl-sn-glycerol-3-phosphate acyltransferase